MTNDEMRSLVARVWICLLGVLFSVAARAELPAEIRVVTYNIHHGEGVDGKFDLPRIAKVMLAEKPDIVAVQEVDQGTRRAEGVDQPAELARLTGMKVIFGRNIDFEGGGYGTAVLTKLPVRSSESVKLKSYYPPTEENAEQRGVQVLELGAKGGPGLLFLCTHLDFRPPDDERMNSALTINELIKKRGSEIAIIAGDFNATPGSRPMQEFAKEWKIAGEETGSAKPRAAVGAKPQAGDGAGKNNGKLVFTYPAERPVRQIDFVMCRPADRWKVVEVRVLDEAVASDHRALVAVLRREL
jgi:endonuclease/exonuclease/phosphatase family metal-dependent hydrolase